MNTDEEYIRVLQTERDALIRDKNVLRLHIQTLIQSESQAVTNARIAQQQLSNKPLKDTTMVLSDLVYCLIDDGIPYDMAMRMFEREFLAQTLRVNKGNQCKTARDMGLHRNTVRRKKAEFSIEVEGK